MKAGVDLTARLCRARLAGVMENKSAWGIEWRSCFRSRLPTAGPPEAACQIDAGSSPASSGLHELHVFMVGLCSCRQTTGEPVSLVERLHVEE